MCAAYRNTARDNVNDTPAAAPGHDYDYDHDQSHDIVVSAKAWARSARRARHCSPRDAKYGNMHGHTGRATSKSELVHPLNTIHKFSHDDLQERMFGGLTPVEERIRFPLQVGERSLDKHRRWEALDDVAALEASEVREFSRNSKDNMWHYQGDTTDTVIAYYADGAEDDSDEDDSDPHGHNRRSMRQSCSSPDVLRPFIRDSFWEGAQRLRESKFKSSFRRRPHDQDGPLASWGNARDVLPPGVAESRLPVSLSSTSCMHQTHVHAALLKSNEYRNVWCPSAADDGRDFLTASLGDNKLVTHIGTKGRFPLLSNDGPVCPEEYVKRYRLFYRERGKSHWLPLGVFQGNTDRNTEVVHRLVDEHTGQPGIVASEFRIQPLSKREGGYRNHKAMRVGLYGRSLERPDDASSEEDQCESGASQPSRGRGNRILEASFADNIFFHISVENPPKYKFHTNLGLGKYNGSCKWQELAGRRRRETRTHTRKISNKLRGRSVKSTYSSSSSGMPTEGDSSRRATEGRSIKMPTEGSSSRMPTKGVVEPYDVTDFTAEERGLDGPEPNTLKR